MLRVAESVILRKLNEEKNPSICLPFSPEPYMRRKAPSARWNMTCTPESVRCQSFKGRHLQTEHQSCVNIDWGKQEKRSHDWRNKEGGERRESKKVDAESCRINTRWNDFHNVFGLIWIKPDVEGSGPCSWRCKTSPSCGNFCSKQPEKQST